MNKKFNYLSAVVIIIVIFSITAGFIIFRSNNGKTNESSYTSYQKFIGTWDTLDENCDDFFGESVTFFENRTTSVFPGSELDLLYKHDSTDEAIYISREDGSLWFDFVFNDDSTLNLSYSSWEDGIEKVISCEYTKILILL